VANPVGILTSPMEQNEVTPVIEMVKPIRRSLIILITRIILVLFVTDTLYAFLLLANVAGYIPTDLIFSYGVFLWIIYTAKYLLLTYAIVKMVIDWVGTLYYVTNGHLIRQRGMLHITETVFQLADIDSAVMSQSWLGRMFNFGDVTIEFTVARQKEFVNLYAINDPQRYEDLFSRYV
jgi:uncharacterized membrane protein YdbT with pleckstrin-like domain